VYNNNSNNNEEEDNVYGAVIVAQSTARVHPVHMMNVERRQAAADPQTRPNDPGCESAARSHTHHRHLLLLLSPKADTHFHFTIPRKVEG